MDGNHQIEIYDSSNRMLKGVLKAAGTSEVAETDIFAGWDFTSGWNTSNSTIDDSNTFSSLTTIGYINTTSIATVGSLHKISITSTLGSGILSYRAHGGSTYFTGNASNAYYTMTGQATLS